MTALKPQLRADRREDLRYIDGRSCGPEPSDKESVVCRAVRRRRKLPRVLRVVYGRERFDSHRRDHVTDKVCREPQRDEKADAERRKNEGWSACC